MRISEEQVRREMEANPGLGAMQAVNNLRNRQHLCSDRGPRIVQSSNWMK